MSHPYYHALSAARCFGGEWRNYIEIENFFDQTKGHIADARHRLLLHNDFGVEQCSEIFGNYVRNSDGVEVAVREVALLHVEEDFGGRVPTVEECFHKVSAQPWMEEAQGFPMDKLAARNFGGIPEDYAEVRLWFENAEKHCADGRARLLVAHTFGIFLCEQRFGSVTIRKSDSVSVPVRSIAEAYILRIFRGRIPTASSLIERVPLKAWMSVHARPLSKELSSRT